MSKDGKKLTDLPFPRQLHVLSRLASGDLLTFRGNGQLNAYFWNGMEVHDLHGNTLRGLLSRGLVEMVPVKHPKFRRDDEVRITESGRKALEVSRG